MFFIIEQASRHCPDLITLDMKMPEMDGYEVIEILQKDDGLKSIPVIAITASALKQDGDVLTKLYDRYLRKPVSRADLVRVLMKHLPHKVKKKKVEETLQETVSTEMIFPSLDVVKRLI